jgi:hypothetical protein
MAKRVRMSGVFVSNVNNEKTAAKNGGSGLRSQFATAKTDLIQPALRPTAIPSRVEFNKSQPLSPAPRALGSCWVDDPGVSLRFTPGRGPLPSISAGVRDFTYVRSADSAVATNKANAPWNYCVTKPTQLSSHQPKRHARDIYTNPTRFC